MEGARGHRGRKGTVNTAQSAAAIPFLSVWKQRSCLANRMEPALPSGFPCGC